MEGLCEPSASSEAKVKKDTMSESEQQQQVSLHHFCLSFLEGINATALTIIAQGYARGQRRHQLQAEKMLTFFFIYLFIFYNASSLQIHLKTLYTETILSLQVNVDQLNPNCVQYSKL